LQQPPQKRKGKYMLTEKKKWNEIFRMVTALGLCVGISAAMPVRGLAGNESGKFRFTATGANAAALSMRSSDTGTLWDGWIGDMGFLSKRTGDGTREKPYQISTKAHLMGLSELAARGMEIRPSEGTYPGDYSGAYFELAKNIDLGGMDWIPIGFSRDISQVPTGEAMAFDGHFDGKGKTISNFRLYRPDWDQVGFFGRVENAEIVNLTLKPGHVITAGENVGILAGSAEGSIIRNVTVTGTLRTAGNSGGVAGSISEGTIVENCMAEHVAIDSGKGKETFTGGIVGRAAEALIADCTVNSGDSLTARIQGGGYVGGITGFQNGTDIFNVHVMGTVGGSGSQAIGGVSGKYASGKMKTARFEGTIGRSGLGSAAREGTFIGTRDTGFHFRYGTEAGADLAYLFADSEAKIAAGICGSGIPDDNNFTYDAHVGFWHSKDNFFTLVQGQNTRPEKEKYFYEELEEGMLHVIDTENAVLEMEFSPDHFAPSPVGRPVRGFLISVLQIDTAANVESYYDVAALTAKGDSAYSKELHKSRRGAVAPGDTVTVMTAPKNTLEEKYQMDGVPTYTDQNGKRTDMSYQTGGSYGFVMPDHDTEISAVYKKVAANIRMAPEEFSLRVTQTRSGDRKAPSLVTEVRNGAGKLIARYLDGRLEEGTKVQEVKLEAVVDKNNDVADSRVSWSVDDKGLILLKPNGDEDEEGYTEKSASIELNMEADFFRDIIEKEEKEQAAKGYQYAIPDTVYGNGNFGGLAVVTAKTRPAASFEGKPLTANCKIPVTFQIKDRTRVAAEGAVLDKKALSFTITRTLSGDRKEPKETISVTAPQTLLASFYPDYFDKKDVQWVVDDENVIQVDAGSYGEKAKGSDYKNASVAALKETKWIQDIITADRERHKEQPYEKQDGYGKRFAKVTVTADDKLGNKETASCDVAVEFETVDETKILPESVTMDKSTLEFDMTLMKTGKASKPTLTWTGIGGQKITAEVFPKAPDGEIGRGIQMDEWPRASWEMDASLLSMDEKGLVVPVTNAPWIQEAMNRYPRSAEKKTQITVRSGNISRTVDVLLKFEMVSKIYSSSLGNSGGSGSSGRNSSWSSIGGTVSSAGAEAPYGSVTGAWKQNEKGQWIFTDGGHTYKKEWAYIYNPYAAEGQESASWFWFGPDGAMRTGWYQDEKDGRWYYFHEVSDGGLGRMYTGWHEIRGFWYFFGRDGRMATGWNWIDGKCYYMDPGSGKMFADIKTPDGYTVDASGAWTVNGMVQTLGKAENE